MRDTYTTPEGFELHRPLLLPDVRDFTEVLTVERPWDFATMNHRNGYPQAETPKEITREGFDRTVSRFCSTRNMDRPHFQVTPTDRVLELIYSLDPEHFAFFDTVSFEAIYHPANERVLILGSASQIIASRYLAYVTLESVPTGERS